MPGPSKIRGGSQGETGTFRVTPGWGATLHRNRYSMEVSPDSDIHHPFGCGSVSFLLDEILMEV